jgi:hypothetical protein
MRAWVRTVAVIAAIGVNLPAATVTFSGGAVLGGLLDLEDAGLPVGSAAITGLCRGFGCLEFQTGALVSDMTAGNQRELRYGSGGFLLITGVSPLGGGAVHSSSGFVGQVSLIVDTLTGDSTLSGSLGPGILLAALATGLSVNSSIARDDVGTSAINVAFLGDLGSGTVNSDALQPIPEPASIGVTMGGLMGLAIAFRRFVRK